MEALVLPKLSAYKPPAVRNICNFSHILGLQLADPEYARDTGVEVLLNADVYADIIQEGIIRGSIGQPIALNSRLGWLLTGSVFDPQNPRFVQENRPTIHSVCESTDASELSALLEEFWRTEEVGSKNSFESQNCEELYAKTTGRDPSWCYIVSSLEDQKCEELYVKTTVRDTSGRYVVRLPWKDPERLANVPIGLSFPQELRALNRLESNFQKEPRLKAEYSSFMQEYLDLGHMSQVIGEKPSSNSDFFFLPHHGVWKESSSTTKLRTVFNGSAKLPTGESLNDLLYVGRNLLKNPVDLICCNRNYKIALSADLEKMYRQTRVHEEDRKYQAILWRFDPTQDILVFVLNTVTYGLAPSAFLALRTIVQLALDYKDENPVASEVINREMYSDNVLSGVHSTQEAREKIKDIISLFKKGQLNLRKWLSNDLNALSALPPEMLTADKINLFSLDTAVPILGIAWLTSSDCFTYHIEEIKRESLITKRTILSRIARLFDPLGWIDPVVVQVKILMQSLWLLKVGWDEKLPDDIVSRWLIWLEDLPAIREIRIPRWTGCTPKTRVVELHGFADASKLAYGAVIYLRLVNETGISISLQNAKSKVAPIKTLSIPRLELCAAVLLVRIVKQYLDSTSIPIANVHLWTDSADVLFWLKDHPSRWNVFVANRCSEIHTSVPQAFWHHVKSQHNPADVVSRGIAPPRLKEHVLWWNGPKFLIEDSSSWSKKQDDLNFCVNSVISASSYKITVTDGVAESLPVWDLIDRFSTLERMLRITALCLRFLSRTTRKLVSYRERKFKLLDATYLSLEVNPESGIISASEMENALSFWMFLTQMAFFKAEHAMLSCNKRLNSSNTLANLKDNLIRVGGRLSHQLSDENAKHPVILPHRSKLTTLLIEEAHLRTLHGGTQLTLATLRQHVWILQARTEVRKVIRSCVKCARYAAVTPTQIMSDLPAARVRPSPPFQSSGVDYAGPVSVRLTKARGKDTLKGYVCVFVCMATCAVHLELVEDCTSETFIAAFHRFTARRGHCKHLYSDRGTNFVGADVLLKQMLLESSDFYSKITKELAKEGTAWSFNPPSSSHFGGLWEAAVKSMKHHVRRVIGELVLTFSELATLLGKIEACLNSRPLVALSDDVTDLDFLTPAHFLIPRASYLVPESDYTPDPVPFGKRWKQVTQLSQHFWTRWSKEYLASLQKRSKWLFPQQPPRIGDTVLLKQELTPPGKWPMGRIIALHPSDDGLPRVVTVRMSTSTMFRPIVKLVRLPNIDDRTI